MVPHHVYVFFHIPRTGGTTINGHLARHLAFDREFIHLGEAGDLWRRRHGRLAFPDRSAEERRQARVIAGHKVDVRSHALVPGAVPLNITILRDPADRIVSIYNLRMAKGTHEPQPFDEWYSGFPRNRASKLLERRLMVGSLDEVIQALRRFWFVGTTEHLDEDLPGVFRSIGVPESFRNLRVAGTEGDDSGEHDAHPFGLIPEQEGRKIRRLVELTDALRERIRADNARDLRLYRFALRHRERAAGD